jgi:uncharacterized protein with PIN domain
MSNALFRFYGGLDYFLAHEVRNGTILYPLDQEADGKVAVKHAVESLGIPHTEVDQITANGRIVGFDYGLEPGDVVEVFAWMPKEDAEMLRPPLPRPVRFVADTHLGRLATYLRLLGFDTLYRNDYSDEMLAELSQQQGRVLLTRDRGLLKRRIVDFGCCVRENDPREQLVALLRRYRLTDQIEPWQRCLRCNALLQPAAKAEINDQLEPKTQRYFTDFKRCVGCGQIYWRGSHYERMQSFIERALASASNQFDA